jgi:hypothetical protein
MHMLNAINVEVAVGYAGCDNGIPSGFFSCNCFPGVFASSSRL